MQGPWQGLRLFFSSGNECQCRMTLWRVGAHRSKAPPLGHFWKPVRMEAPSIILPLCLPPYLQPNPLPSLPPQLMMSPSSSISEKRLVKKKLASLISKNLPPPRTRPAAPPSDQPSDLPTDVPTNLPSELPIKTEPIEEESE